MKIIKDVLHAQAWGCVLYVQFGSVGVMVGNWDRAPRYRIELFRPMKPRFRFSKRSAREVVR